MDVGRRQWVKSMSDNERFDPELKKSHFEFKQRTSYPIRPNDHVFERQFLMRAQQMEQDNKKQENDLLNVYNEEKEEIQENDVDQIKMITTTTVGSLFANDGISTASLTRKNYR